MKLKRLIHDLRQNQAGQAKSRIIIAGFVLCDERESHGSGNWEV